MPKDDQAARKARAERLRKEIEELTSKDKDVEEAQKSEAPKDESPRDFIQRRMRELDKKEKDDD